MIPRLLILLALMVTLSTPAAAPLKQGDAFTLNSQPYTLSKLDSLPFIDSDYSRRFRFDRHDNPKLKELRETYDLEEVVAPGKTEFDRQILLLDWAHNRFKKFGKPTSDARGALNILSAIDDGHTFFCSHYGDVLVSAAASMGWVCRPLALRRPDHLGSGSTEHTSTEIWSNQHRKWVLFDPTFAMYVEKDGLPLSAYEFRQHWFHHRGKNLTFVIGKDKKKYPRSALPIFRHRFPGFGDLSVDDSALNVYAFIAYVPNTDLMDRGLDYGNMFITQDSIGGSTKWHKRTIPQNPAADPYFPINQASITLTSTDNTLKVTLQTLTPNFKTYLARFDEGDWKPIPDTFIWPLKAQNSRLEVKTVNHFGIDGSISIVEISPSK